jgi:hypothetical protein
MDDIQLEKLEFELLNLILEMSNVVLYAEYCKRSFEKIKVKNYGSLEAVMMK